ncbi:hypothetical protein GJ496_011051 [Pomphorhynchus laevis]|nr:hypothetical protein GJ496_011051 [Pomphorhynchus laevis]
MWEFYSDVYHRVHGRTDNCILSGLLRKKCDKLARCAHKRISIAELEAMDLKMCIRFRMTKSRQCRVININHNVANLLKEQLSEAELQLLSLGMSFVPSSKEFGRLNLINSIKYMAAKIFRNGDNRYLELHPDIKFERNLNAIHVNVLKELQHNSNIIVMSADKGNQTVIWATAEYIAEGNRQLQTNAYEAIPETDHNNMANGMSGQIIKCSRVCSFYLRFTKDKHHAQ